MAGSRGRTSHGRALAALILGALAWRVTSTTRIPQDIDKNLLNILKRNLRRHNDDYKDRLVNDDVTIRPSPAPRPSSSSPGPRASLAPPPRAERRAFDTFDLNGLLELSDSNQDPSKEESQAVAVTGPSRASVRSRPVQPTPRQRAFASPSPQRKQLSSSKARPKVGKAARADILDMAPAKGNRINAKREKGRLCHRHVLLLEGPKYDEGGTAYQLAHSSRRPFPSTRAASLLLPACCNCCRKSVLGCE